MAFAITSAFLVMIAPSVCPVFNQPLVYERGVQGAGAGRWSPSIDRIDNSQGYVEDNVVVVSQLANVIKSSATAEEVQMVASFYSTLTASTPALV